MLKIRKLGFWLLIMLLLGVCVNEGITRYAIRKAPPEIVFTENKRAYAREYLFAKVPPPGGVYEDEYYRFRLLKGTKFVTLPNGYSFDVPYGYLFELHEFADWTAYLDYYAGFTLMTKVRAAKQIESVHGKLPFPVLPVELYGRILPDTITNFTLSSGESGITFVCGGFYGKHRLEVLILKKSGHVVNMSQISMDGRIDRVNQAALKVFLESLVCRKDMPVENVTDITVIDYERKYLLPESKERKSWQVLQD